MKIKQQAFVLLALLMAVHLGVLTFASVECISRPMPSDELKCETLGTSWQRTAESYVAVILALLVPTNMEG